MQPINEFGFDASILFSDIMVPLPPMGLAVDFTPGPVIAQPIQNESDIAKLKTFDPNEELSYVMDAVRAIRKALPSDTPLIGFAGSPFTMMTYCVEGGGSKAYPKTRAMMYGNKKATHALLSKLAQVTADYLVAQANAGANALQLFDSWAGILPPSGFEEFALKYAKLVIDNVRERLADQCVPIIYFANGCAPYLNVYANCGADVLGIDWRVDLAAARKALGSVPVQGNMDPGCLYLPPEELRKEVISVIEKGRSTPGHIFNLGHGVMPTAPMENVRLMVDTVKSWSA